MCSGERGGRESLRGVGGRRDELEAWEERKDFNVMKIYQNDIFRLHISRNYKILIIRSKLGTLIVNA